MYDILKNKQKTHITMKKIFIVTLAALTLASCGNKADKKNSTNATNSTVSTSGVAVVEAGDIV